MDDCNLLTSNFLAPFQNVQIPLWTIVTLADDLQFPGILCSDSSMDDCNANIGIHPSTLYEVQIPLWTIVTHYMMLQRNLLYSSDSSMDDCNIPPEVFL